MHPIERLIPGGLDPWTLALQEAAKDGDPGYDLKDFFEADPARAQRAFLAAKGLRPRSFNLVGRPELSALPEGFNPEGFSPRVCHLRGCTGLEALPEGFRPEECDLRGCTALTPLPEGFDPETCNLNDSGIADLPDSMTGAVWLSAGGFIGAPAEEVRRWLRFNRTVLDAVQEELRAGRKEAP